MSETKLEKYRAGYEQGRFDERMDRELGRSPVQEDMDSEGVVRDVQPMQFLCNDLILKIVEICEEPELAVWKIAKVRELLARQPVQVDEELVEKLWQRFSFEDTVATGRYYRMRLMTCGDFRRAIKYILTQNAALHKELKSLEEESFREEIDDDKA